MGWGLDGCRGHVHQRAVTLARKEIPEMLDSVEGAWGAWLAAQGRPGEAIKHFTAAGQPEAAVEAAAAARNWDAAFEILAKMVSNWLPFSSYCRCVAYIA